MTLEQVRTFCRIWVESDNVDEVAIRFRGATGLDLDRRACSNKAAGLRRKGVPLPKHRSRNAFPPRSANDLTRSDHRNLAVYVGTLVREKALRNGTHLEV